MKLLDDLNLFRLVVENGSYTAASRKSTVPVATMTRRIQALEDSLNIRLLNRHARKLSLTEAGEKFYNECGPLLQKIVNSAESITEECMGAAGQLKIASPANFIKYGLQPLLNDFMQQYPQIDVLLETSNEPETLDPTDWDVIFRAGRLRDSTLIARKLGTLADILVASPEYLKHNPMPKHANDLHQHALLKGKPLIRWSLKNSLNEVVTISDKARFEVNEIDLVKKACLSGLGITLIPDILVRNYIKNGELIHILPDWSSNIRDKYLIYNHREYQPEKLKIFIDFVSKYSLPN